MKKFKKALAMILAMAMVLGMSMTVFASDVKTAPTKTTKSDVVVKGLKQGTEVNYVKILEPDSTSSKGWKLTGSVPEAGIGMTLDQILAVTDKGEDGKINTSLTGLDFSKLATTSETKVAGTDGKVIFKEMTPGLYAIKANDGSGEYVYSWMVAYVGFDGEEAIEITAKGASNQVTKSAKDKNNQSVERGEEIEYEVSVEYPFFTEGMDGKGFEIEDTLTNGTLVSINSDSRTALEALGFVVPTDEAISGQTTMKIALDMKEYKKDRAGEKVTITYTVKADEDISGTEEGNDQLINTVTSTVKTKKDEEGKKTESKVIHPTFDVNVNKTDKDDNVIKDSTATFQLYKVSEADGAVEMDVYVPASEGEDKGTTAKKKLITVGSAVTTVNGVASFKGLDAESGYYVKETVAPDGYALDDLAYPLTGATTKLEKDGIMVDGVKVTEFVKVTDFDDIGFGHGLNFHDDTVSSLPSTGGIGTTIFTIGGCVIMIIAAGLFFASRRKSAK